MQAMSAARYYDGRINSQWRQKMRKPRDIDSELKALADKAKQLKERRVLQLGELVLASGADASDAETLAGAFLEVAGNSDTARKEGWRKRGAAFFQGTERKCGEATQRLPEGARAADSGAASA
jgi:DNA-binding protein H-NS